MSDVEVDHSDGDELDDEDKGNDGVDDDDLDSTIDIVWCCPI